MGQVYHRGPAAFLAAFCVLSFAISSNLSPRSALSIAPLLLGRADLESDHIDNHDHMEDDKLKVSFLDIGQGDSILIQAPNGNSLLIDSGPTGGKVLAEISKQKSFFDKQVDALLVTHGDADHVGSMADVIKKYSAGLFIYSGVHAPTKLYSSLIEYVKSFSVDSARDVMSDLAPDFRTDFVASQPVSKFGSPLPNESSAIESSSGLKNLIAMNGMNIILDSDKGVRFEILFPNFLYELDNYETCSAKTKGVSKSIKILKSSKTAKRLKSVFESCKKFLQLETNENSIVGRLVYGSTTFMLTGDAPIPTENFIIDNLSKANQRAASTSLGSMKTGMAKNETGNEQDDLHSTVLKLGHHGSRTSTSDEFLNAVAPEYAVISSGKDNRYGHPNPETLGRVKKYFKTREAADDDGAVTGKKDNASDHILRTDESGTITFVSDGKHVMVQTEK